MPLARSQLAICHHFLVCSKRYGVSELESVRVIGIAACHLVDHAMVHRGFPSPQVLYIQPQRRADGGEGQLRAAAYSC